MKIITFDKRNFSSAGSWLEFGLKSFFFIEFIPNLEYNIIELGGKNMEYLTSNEIAEKWNISSRRVRILCGEGRVEGAIQKVILWLIPSNTQKPQELRRGRKKQDDI